jgi:hypothetical protein
MKIIMMGLMACFMLSQTASAQTRDLNSFDKLKVSGGIKVNLIKSNDQKAEVDMVRGDYDELVTEVKGDVLVIKFKSKALSWGNNNNKANIDLYYKSLSSVDASAGSSVKGDGLLKGSDVSVEVSSGASVSVEVDSDELSVDISSGASCSLSGKAGEQDVDVSSGATYDGSKVASSYVKVDASSGATAKVWATERLVADASSGASIKYKGNPKKTEIDAGKWSGGSIKKMGGDE